MAAEAEGRESRENRIVPSPISFQSTEDRQLIFVVGNAEARLEPDVGAELAQQLCAKRMDGSPLDPLHACVELALQPRSDFISCLVGEGEDADSLGVDIESLDEKANPLDQAESFPCTRPGEHEHGA